MTSSRPFPFFAFVDIEILVSPRIAKKNKVRKKSDALPSARAEKTHNLQGAIKTVRQVVATIGPATARQIETHPEVVKACRSSKTKARRHIERLLQLGHIKSCGSAQMPKFWV